MMQAEQSAIEMMRGVRKELESQGFKDNGLGETVIEPDLSEIEERISAMHPALYAPYGVYRGNKPWHFIGHLANGVKGSRLHYTIHNYVTGETLCTYRQIKKARNVVRQLNNGVK